jgi:hypothetical protein
MTTRWRAECLFFAAGDLKLGPIPAISPENGDGGYGSVRLKRNDWIS